MADPILQSQITPVESQPIGYDLLDYAKAKIRIDKLISDWSTLRTEAKLRREDRYIQLDVRELRQSGKIGKDETFIPTRIIDSNIMRDKADAMQFLNSSHRLAYFRPIDNPAADTRQLESDFTKGMTYKGWYKNMDREYDGAALHGWDTIEVVYDESKPLRVAHEHVGYDKLFFNKNVTDIQDAEIVVREYIVTSINLEDFVTKFGFDGEQVKTLLSQNRENSKIDQTYKIYKKMCKVSGIVYVSWYSKELNVSDWLKAPEPLKLGIGSKPPPMPISIGASMTSGPENLVDGNTSQNSIQGGQTNSLPTTPALPAPIDTFIDEPITMYPYYLFIYREDEQEPIIDHYGRAFLDKPQQEAVTAVTTGYVNRMLRSSNVFASADSDDPDALNKLEGVELENGTIFPTPVRFFSIDPPDPGTLTGLQFLGTVNAAQTGKMAVAVSNRKDSRKTAKELGLADQEQTKITSTNLAEYSEHIRDILELTWKIVQSQALAGHIKIALKQVTSPPDPMTGATSMEWQTDMELVSMKFDIRPAGDIDVIQKQQTLADMQQDWPVVQSTPLAPVFIEDYIRLKYPLQADKYVQILKAGDPGKQLVTALLEVIKGSLQPEEVKALSPQDQQGLIQLSQQAEAYIGQGQPQEAAA